jgi:2-polyprenyl-6-methoxyphenol hydroxylase-like FAD-dependent oxidoreductase
MLASVGFAITGFGDFWGRPESSARWAVTYLPAGQLRKKGRLVRQVPVLVSGAGPVGMTLAYELAMRGISTLLVERNATTTRHPKMDITNARSMELFRRLGLTKALRSVGVPESNNFDVSWITTLAGHELHRFRYPSVTQWRDMIRERNDGSMPAEPPMRVSQVEIEPVLARAVRSHCLIDARWGVTFEELSQDPLGVTVTLRAEDGQTERVRCDYVVGCDGGSSEVRRSLGIRLGGQAAVMQRFMTHFRSDALTVLQRWGQAWHYQSPKGTLIAQDDRNIWTLQSRFNDGVVPNAAQPNDLLQDFAGCDFEYQILVANTWTPHLLVADSYGFNRVFLAGDAAHQYIPTGGYGMNTGIGDACDLGWKLAAVLRGFAAPALLDSYELERRPVGLRNREASRRHSETRAEIAGCYNADLSRPGPAGELARIEIGRRIADIGNAENESFGIEFGYVYHDSPIVCAEPNTDVQMSEQRYVPTTTPGARLPSVILRDGATIFDRLGHWFTLICSGTYPSDALINAAENFGVPLQILRIGDPEHEQVYGRGLLLVRPDQHIAWRGPDCDDPKVAELILARCVGRYNI